MWILNQWLWVISIGIFYVEAVEPVQDYLSPRAWQAIINSNGWRTLNQTVLSKPYDPKEHPKGIINLGLAENWLIQDELKEYLQHNFSIDPLSHLTYGQGAAASPTLRAALAGFFRTHFKPSQPVSEYDFIVASGVTSLIDSLTWCICSDNEAIIIPRPLYNGFPTDMRLRSNGTLLPASFMQGNETSKEALIAIASFCGRHRIHLISDEIYANSVFPDANLFTSVLSLNLSGIIDPNLVHVMYGMSKDFGASGLRLGSLYSRNQNLIQAAAGVNLFSWPSYLAQDMWARLLQNETKTDELLSKNRNRLNQTYSNVTSWLDQRNITYFRGGNAGLFVWARVLNVSESIGPEKYNQTVACFLEACRCHGVNIGDGRNFVAEGGFGWFRITFSYPFKMLECGLTRLGQVLDMMKDGECTCQRGG
ncbi:pyridoxal phosphate-dependent transferase [Aspergillus tamarii]|uniref:Pyridoxal phosphate-dependent transferase n=1 Tax=Aspergillus tamarii TaxID=41984 RepID=A0A5N6VC63_ASPTM|nr:pyridoxal phosphate-dependent transferase [Aspergillus tamarii]